jgi:4-hydroxybenzoate polyprenyltransferase
MSSDKKFTLEKFIDLVRFEQTLFALPFAYLGVMAAYGGIPKFFLWLWVTLAMLGARTAGMSLNRIIDLNIDKKNPRTAGRLLPAGKVTGKQVWLLASSSLLLLIFSAWMLNPLCLKLSPLAVVLLWSYSYCKRFTWLTHFFLGLVEAAAPIGGWLAVTGEWSIKPFFLGSAIIFWMAGLDIIYGCQDYDIDKKEGLFSVPAYFGLKKALYISKICHIITILFFFIFGYVTNMGLIYYTGLIVISFLFIYEHSLVGPNELKHVNKAFFTVNSWISIAIFLFALLDIIIL